MHNRLRLLRLFTGLLYFGPLLAGLIGQGWAMVPVFLAIFLLWSIILRPHLWPQTPSDLTQSEAAVALASLIATQALLVVVLFALGRGIGGVLALKPALPVVLPAALSFLAVPLSRMVWNPRVIADAGGFDPLLHDLAPLPGDAEALLRDVTALPDDVAEDVLQHHLSAMADVVDPVHLRQILSEAAPQRRASVKALIIHATDPAVSDLLSGSGYPAQAFAAAGRDAELLTLFATRCMRVLEDEPDLARDCPDAATLLRAAAEVSDPAARTALTRLAGLLDQRKPD